MPEQPDPTPPTSNSAAGIPLRTLAGEKTGALDPKDTVQTAGDRMREFDTTQWPVAEGRKLVGTIDEKDPDLKIGGRGHDPKSWLVGQIMKREFAFCYEDQDCATARQLMQDRKLQFLPVVDREMRIVGIFSREEIQEKADAQAAGKK